MNCRADEGLKLDSGKPRWSLVPWGAMASVVRVLTFGAKKYADDNWKHVANARTRYYDAAMRHLTAWWLGEEKDPETGESHLAHAACCVLYLLSFAVGETAAVIDATVVPVLRLPAPRYHDAPTCAQCGTALKKMRGGGWGCPDESCSWGIPNLSKWED